MEYPIKVCFDKQIGFLALIMDKKTSKYLLFL
jgi:hypothetical protein